jgi:hypothetical protein
MQELQEVHDFGGSGVEVVTPTGGAEVVEP